MKCETTAVDLPVVGTGVLANGHAFYLVPSESDPTRFYAVEQLPARLECQCKDAFFRHRVCKHQRAVMVHKAKLQLETARAEDRAIAASVSHGTSSSTPAPRWGGRSQAAFSLLK